MASSDCLFRLVSCFINVYDWYMSVVALISDNPAEAVVAVSSVHPSEIEYNNLDSHS
mgnify:CR=1 FL=1